jgi:cytochrome c oxidase subunit 2
VPVGKKVRMLTTATDVIHSWWVPALAVKQDAIPGYVRDTWFKAEKEGIYRGQCAELCGKDHAFMPIVVEVVSAEKYAVGRRAEAADGRRGRRGRENLFAGRADEPRREGLCHQLRGLPPGQRQGPAARLPGARRLEDRQGAQGGAHRDRPARQAEHAMAAYGGQLSDGDIAAVVTYERNAWGNKTGDVVQPAEIKAARK